jgi:hypothetical protein
MAECVCFPIPEIPEKEKPMSATMTLERESVAPLTLEIEDLTGQVRHRVQADPRMHVAEFVQGAEQQLHLPEIDASGRPVRYGARSSDGDVLNPTDRLGDVVRPGAVVTLTKSVTAGRSI